MSYASFNYRYSGGSLEVNDPTYVIRQADRDFYDGLKAGEFCYVLNSRQMGKSSLRVRTMAKLQAEGIICAFIDLTAIGKEGVTSEQWYADFVRSLVNSCSIQFDWRKWWREQRDLLSPPQRLKVFIEEVLLVKVRQKIVIFVDEIDRVLSQDFSLDDFFAIIRSCYDFRGNKTEYCRLTWALLGVATPSDLIGNPYATPFNIGRAIALRGFKLTESSSLSIGLRHLTDRPEKLLRQILSWTGGQPFLTQKLCWSIASSQTKITLGTEAQFVAAVVNNALIKNWESQDEPPHLKTIRTRILYSTQSTKRLLLLYQKILRRGKIIAKKYPEHQELQLSGLVVKQSKYLKVCNPIYEAVFDRRWVKQQLAVLNKPDRISLKIAFLTSVFVACLVAGMRSLAVFQSWELAAFDFLMRHRPLETPDSRLLIIGVTEKDLNTYGYPLPDTVLARLLTKIQQNRPSAIGLDIVRDLPVPQNDLSGHRLLNLQFRNNSKLIPVCAFNTNPAEAIAPPPASPNRQLGFVDLYNDLQYQKGDKVRRYLLSRSINHSFETCPTSYSFVWQLVYLYLEDRGVAIDTVDNNWRFGSLVIERLQQQSAGYQNIDSRGNQILLNYRNTADSRSIARQISVGEILDSTKKLNPDLIKNKIILIGVTAPSIPDRHDTPYGEMKGIEIHAHAISQIISAVENARPLIEWLPSWQDTVLIWVWSFAGGLIVWRVQIRFYRNIATGISIATLYSFYWILFVWGLWLPLVPSAIALLTTVTSLVGLTGWKRIKAQE